uniref:Elongation of fatty acids protein n=1 Tax=Chromera velia CCMP2878 TaxID=1169474 RepID=A0A0G4HD55_9ALVE|eukprot:Cvel_6334.t1-p1 / transcript=Cvel_6334.t1 / gene=Cvel_6334 / organism=Chromera_velia_CCMP2878 / gene_product=Putative fatty acid elongation protein 4, putative / transcript_product=Putative fatty acid elongation protein 4, putative / location=Cvel_scaffold307:70862-71965(+) / protein_length=193 / sequence_SO=supercontig / SO=protein_coding / is_pseudo=false
MALFSLATGILSVVRLQQLNWDIFSCGWTSAPFFGSLTYHHLVVAFYISKYIEFLDTVFIVLDGKHPIFLHRFHHAGATIALHLLAATRDEGAIIFLGLNGFVHAVMYTYYHFSKSLRWMRPFITSGQILQFLAGFYIYYPFCTTECFWSDPQKRISFVYQYAFVGVVMLFFLKFFVEAYMPKKGKRISEKAA